MSVDHAHTPEALAAEYGDLAHRLALARRYDIGYPGAVDFDYTDLAELLCRHLLNNVGDPFSAAHNTNQSKEYEREVIAFVAKLLRAPEGDHWGYVTSGGSEGNLYGLRAARRLYPDGVGYVSSKAHYSIYEALDLLLMEYVVIRADDSTGVLDYADLSRQIDRRRPVIIAATAGTTMHEAVDDLHEITRILDDAAISRRYLHVDAALAGIPLALLEANQRPGFDFADGADSITISGHKFLGAPQPCGVVITRASHRSRACRTVGYPAQPDATLLCSRSGHAPLLLHHAIARHGINGLRTRAETSRALAAYTHQKLVDLGWHSVRHPHAFTVVMQTPPKEITNKWVLATVGELSHVITMPGVTRDTIDQFLEDVAGLDDSGTTNGGPVPPPRPITDVATQVPA